MKERKLQITGHPDAKLQAPSSKLQAPSATERPQLESRIKMKGTENG